MKSSILLIALTAPLVAQDIAPKDSERDPVLSALLEAEDAASTGGPSVSVELAADANGPVLVTGSPPPDADFGQQEPLTPEETRGVRVEIEAGSSKAQASSSEIKLLAPFPAKPLSPAPEGWKLVQPEETPAFSKTVELANGSSVTLSIRPHVLVPDDDGTEVFGFTEPGFDSAQQYDQKDTIGAVLADSIMSLDSNSDRLSAAARRLDDLLTSLPAPVPVASPVDSPVTQP